MENTKKAILGILGILLTVTTLVPNAQAVLTLINVYPDPVIIYEDQDIPVRFQAATNSATTVTITVDGYDETGINAVGSIPLTVTLPDTDGYARDFVYEFSTNAILGGESGIIDVTVADTAVPPNTDGERMPVTVLSTAACTGITPAVIDDIEAEDQTGDDEINPGDTTYYTLGLDGDARYEHLKLEATLRDSTDMIQLGRTLKTGDLGTLSVDQEREVRFSLTVPENLQVGHDYETVIRLTSTTSFDNPNRHGCVEVIEPLDVTLPEDSLLIRDVRFSSDNVKPGSSFTVSARVFNNGENEQEDVTVRAEVKDLGISAEGAFGTIFDDSDEEWTVALGIPSDAKEGSYKLTLSVWSEDVRDPVTEAFTVNVGSGAARDGGLSARLTATEKTQDVGKSGEVYDLTVVNRGGSEATFVIEVEDTSSWARSVEVTPRTILTLDAGETKDIQVFVAPKDGASGEYDFTVNVESVDGENLDSIELAANVKGAARPRGFSFAGFSEDTVIRGLQWVFAILIIVAIVLFIVWLGRKGAKPEGKEGEDKVYY